MPVRASDEGSGTEVRALVDTMNPLGPLLGSVKRKLSVYDAPTVVAIVWE
jgi:hypothetical protein